MTKFRLAIVLLVAVMSFTSCGRKSSKHLSLYMPDNDYIRYSGRIDFTDPQKPKLSGAGAYFELQFSGSSCYVFLKDQNLYDNYNYFAIVIDDKYQGRIKMGNKNKYQIAKNLKDTVHKLLICKATEAEIGYVEFLGILCNNILPYEKSYTRKIEFIGNSITCGMGLDISNIPCDSGQWYDQHNAYLAYGPLVARQLGADWMLSSVSGIGITRFWNKPGPTMPQVYQDTYLNTDSTSVWDRQGYTPDLVSICLGQNDFSKGDGSYDRPPLDSARFVNEYIRFAGLIREQYPYAQICCLTSPMLDDKERATMKNYLAAVLKYMKEVKNDKMIHIYSFSRSYVNGCASHPDREDHEKMAAELLPFFKEVMNWQ
jgi:lysophospholipase L1-like esterase